MPTLKEAAQGYIPQQVKNIAELESIPIDIPIHDGEATNKDKETFKYKYIELNGEEYRVPDKVLKDLKAIMEKKPTLKSFSVSKTGSGINTQYTVIPMD